MEKTTLQKIIDQKTDQIRNAIEEAIENGAKIDKGIIKCVTIDNVFVQQNYDGDLAIVLRFESKKITKLFAPSKIELEKMAEKKRAELADIEKQLKERAKE